MRKYSGAELLAIAKDCWNECQNADVEQLMDILSAINAFELEISDEDILKLQAVVNNVWLKLDGNASLQHEVDCIVQYMVDENVSADDVLKLTRDELDDATAKYHWWYW